MTSCSPGCGATRNLCRRKYLSTALLIIDKLGFEPMNRQDANLFFQLVTYRYSRGAFPITTNRSVREWTELLAGDEVLATAVLDRLLHRANVLNIKGRSYRLRDPEQAFSDQKNLTMKNLSDRHFVELVVALTRKSGCRLTSSYCTKKCESISVPRFISGSRRIVRLRRALSRAYGYPLPTPAAALLPSGREAFALPAGSRSWRAWSGREH